MDNLTYEKRQAEADDRERDIAEGWTPPTDEPVPSTFTSVQDGETQDPDRKKY